MSSTLVTVSWKCQWIIQVKKSIKKLQIGVKVHNRPVGWRRIWDRQPVGGVKARRVGKILRHRVDEES